MALDSGTRKQAITAASESSVPPSRVSLPEETWIVRFVGMWGSH